VKSDAAVLYAEPGSRWRALLFGPAFSGIGYAVDRSLGAGLSVFAWVFVALLISSVVALQVVAGRRHASVELTREALRQGTESVGLDEIAEVFPPVDPDRPRSEVEAWESARALGELRGVPRRRTGIGLRLSNGGLVQAWAINDKALRTALEQALGTRP
jgi:hypothetical protein